MSELMLNIVLSFLSAMAGAYGGALAATWWQEKKEEKSLVKAREATIINALIICRHYGEVISKVDKKIVPDGRELEWYEVNLVEIFMPPNIQHNPSELITYLGKSEYDLVASIIHAEWVAKSAINVIEKRDLEYAELQKYLISKGSSRKLSKEQATKIIGDAWSAKLDSLTKEMHTAVRAAIRQNMDCFNSLVKLLPNEKKLKDAFERIEPTITF
ncbi:hypothetical protein [Alteromonas sp. OM2203]|uniref:hypothetical protein n=1 Tax=Alteromonas sp. OM2203 TaxID=3398817 RepID=UPI003AF3E810